MSVDEVHRHYLALGNVVFKRSLLRWGALRAKFDGDKVREALIGVLGERTMDSKDFRTGLLVVTKRLDTGSAWPISNNPKARYFRSGTQSTTDDRDDGRLPPELAGRRGADARRIGGHRQGRR